VSIRRFVVAAAMAGVMLGVVPVTAEQNGGGPPPAPAQAGVGTASPITLKVTVTISRWDGEKKLASAPYVLMVVPSYGKIAETDQDGSSTSVQMGSETPIPVSEIKDGKPSTTINYRTLGTNINISGRPVSDGRFNLSVGVQDSQLSAPPAGTAAQGATPRYQTFRSQNRLTLRDGQTTQYAVATDTLTGQVVKLDVTMNVVK